MTSKFILDAGTLSRSTFYKEETSLRLSRYQECWNMYLGDHWIQDESNDGDPLVTVNYCAPFVEKAAAFLMAPQGANKQGVRFMPPDEVQADADGDGKIDKTFNETDIIPYVNTVWEQNNKQATLMEMAMMGGITGDCFVKVGWDEPQEQTPTEELNGEPAQEEKEDEWGNPLKIAPGARPGQVTIDVLDPSLVFPVYDEHNRSKLISCTLMYFITNPDEPEGDPVVYKETYTREYIEVQLGEKSPYRIANALKEIPIVHIHNFRVPGKKYGKSDIHDIIHLQHQLNEKITDISDIITYHAAPITIVQGAKVQQMEAGARRVWSGLPKEAEVYNLEIQSELSASREHVTFVKQSMHELTGIPESSLGKDMAISNTSGVALSIMYQPLLDRRNMKMATYGEGLQRINRLIIKLGEVMRQITIGKEVKNKYKTLIDFGDPLPKDELIALQVAGQEIALGLKSRMTVMRERGVKNPEQEFQAWLQEQEIINGMQMAMETEANMKLAEHKAAASAAFKPSPSGGSSGKSNNPSGKKDSQTSAAAKAALKSNLAGFDTSQYRPGDASKNQR